MTKFSEFVSADKSDQYIPNIRNDIYIEIIRFVTSNQNEQIILNISYDICGKMFRLISADQSDQYIPNISNDIYIEIIRLVTSDQTDLMQNYFYMLFGQIITCSYNLKLSISSTF